MGKAGDSLKQALGDYGISQSKLAEALGVERPIVFRWFHGQTDPTAETVVMIVDALRDLNAQAADAFISLYLGSPSQMSVTPAQTLPESEQVNISALAGLFANTTNSYKYLFFMSLLDILYRRQFDVLSPISFQEIIVEMLANAWYPHTFFKLSFGTQDQISQKLDSLKMEIEEPIVQFRDTDKRLLRKAIASQDLKDVISHLRQYVPFRLLKPFLNQELELSGVNSGKGTELEYAMPAIAEQIFESCKPLYRFNSTQYKDCDSVIIHADWAAYFEQHYSIIRGWVAWEWLTYMQKRNPSTPAIANKLFMPRKRDALTKQTKYWKLVMQSQPIHCIYSRQPLQTSNISLDHYLPWSFVAHDQLWNLIPSSPEVNSSKSNNLPSEVYFSEFVKLQHLGLTVSHQNMKRKAWLGYVEPFISDLKIQVDNLLIEQELEKAYRSNVNSLLSLAARQGFSSEWKYRI